MGRAPLVISKCRTASNPVEADPPEISTAAPACRKRIWIAGASPRAPGRAAVMRPVIARRDAQAGPHYRAAQALCMGMPHRHRPPFFDTIPRGVARVWEDRQPRRGSLTAQAVDLACLLHARRVRHYPPCVQPRPTARWGHRAAGWASPSSAAFSPSPAADLPRVGPAPCLPVLCSPSALPGAGAALHGLPDRACRRAQREQRRRGADDRRP